MALSKKPFLFLSKCVAEVEKLAAVTGGLDLGRVRNRDERPETFRRQTGDEIERGRDAPRVSCAGVRGRDMRCRRSMVGDGRVCLKLDKQAEAVNDRA